MTTYDALAASGTEKDGDGQGSHPKPGRRTDATARVASWFGRNGAVAQGVMAKGKAGPPKTTIKVGWQPDIQSRAKATKDKVCSRVTG